MNTFKFIKWKTAKVQSHIHEAQSLKKQWLAGVAQCSFFYLLNGLNAYFSCILQLRFWHLFQSEICILKSPALSLVFSLTSTLLSSESLQDSLLLFDHCNHCFFYGILNVIVSCIFWILFQYKLSSLLFWYIVMLICTLGACIENFFKITYLTLKEMHQS